MSECERLPQISQEWLAEIERRSAEYEAGRAQAIPWEQVRRESRLRAGLQLGDSVAREPPA